MLQKIIPSLVFLMAAGTLAAQSIIIGPNEKLLVGSMHDVIDGRSTALGESLVAGARTPLAWNINPATLAGVDGTGISYSTRNLLYQNTGYFQYNSMGGFVGTGIGTFAAHYNRLDFGKYQFTFDTVNPETGAKLWPAYDQTIALSYATDLLEPVSLGVTLKLFNDRMIPNIQGGDEETGLYLDIGAIYSARGFLDGALAADSVHAGISVQNLGSEYEYPFLQQSIEVGQILRAGAGYDVKMLMEDEKPVLRASLTAEYRRLLNPPEIWERANYWGAGLEATLYDLVSLRGGMIFFPVDNIYGKGNRRTFRYGAGLNLPLSKLGVEPPISLAIDYAFIPLDPDHFFNDPVTPTLHAINARITYNGPIL